MPPTPTHELYSEIAHPALSLLSAFFKALFLGVGIAMVGLCVGLCVVPLFW